jgi:hypothetical protein
MGKPNAHRALPAREPTRGTETSKYPEERKSIETPLVAASERGIAQTIPGFWDGVVGPVRWTEVDRRRTWKGLAQRVIPPYSKSMTAWRCS